MPDHPRLPVTILSGFLGSGKTTLLNHILTTNHGLRIGVIVNEFGELGVDADLIVGTQEEVVQLSNGCTCCTVRSDLYAAVRQMLAQATVPDYILIETTGIADPLPVAQTFLLPDMAARLRLDSIVTVVDAENYAANLAVSSVARDQLTAADLLVLNKTDLVDATRLAEVRGELQRLNPRAPLFETVHARLDLRLLLDVGAFALERYLEMSAVERHPDHVHQDHLTSVAFETAAPLDPRAFLAFSRTIPPQVIRAKGVLNFAMIGQRIIMHRVGPRSYITWGDDWGDRERLTRVVLIGKDLDRAGLLARLAATTVPAVAGNRPGPGDGRAATAGDS